MSKTPKKRLCWNCEGNVTLNAEICPYCGVSVVPASLENPASQNNFKPSYQMEPSHDNPILNSPYEQNMGSKPLVKEAEASQVNDEGESALDAFQNTLIATILLLSGSVLFLFSLALAFFARNGVLTLQWDGTLWYLYAALALPLLILGWRSLSKLS